MEQKLKHLEFIQGVVNRLGADSFFAKAWSVTLVAALFALYSKDANPRYIAIAFIPVVSFWILDGYFLWQERLFRAMYDQVRLKEEVAIDFGMNTTEFIRGRNTWFRSIFSTTLLVFYLSLIVTMSLVYFFLQ